MVSDVPAGCASRTINLRSTTVLCVDKNFQSLEIMCQIMMGFGVERTIRAASGDMARSILKVETIDLIVVEARLPDMSGLDLVKWLRHSRIEPNCYAPVIVATSNPSEQTVAAARDSGSNFVIAKPLAAGVLLQRIMWAARGGRAFVECDTYVGPDRRWKATGVPGGGVGRRKEDLSPVLGQATEPNMSQQAVDTFIKPQRMSLS